MTPEQARPVDLAGLRRLAEAATPGPWWFTGDVESIPVTVATDPYAELDKQPGEAWPRNAAYIAAISPDVFLAILHRLAMSPEIERLRAIEAASRALIRLEWSETVELAALRAALDQ